MNFGELFMSNARQECSQAVKEFSEIILAANLPRKKLMYVGLAGDPEGGEYSSMFNGFNITTMDIDSKWNPQIIDDIANLNQPNESWDVIVCTQVLEHVKDIWNVPNSIYRTLSIGGYAIVDCPWMYPYHAEPPSFGDYWRLSKDGMKELFKKFHIEKVVSTNNLTSCLIKKL